jgi:hypothetical protein
MDDHAFVLCGLWRLHEVGRSRSRSLVLGLKCIEHLDNCIAMFGERLLCHLDVHFCTVLLQTKLGVLLEPPRCDLPLTDSTKNGERRRMVAWVTGSLFGEASEIVCKHFSSHTQRLDEHFWEVDGHLAKDGRADHPHSLSSLAHTDV